MKRVFVLMLVVIFMAGFLVGCTNSTDETDEPEETVSESDTDTGSDTDTEESADTSVEMPDSFKIGFQDLGLNDKTFDARWGQLSVYVCCRGRRGGTAAC